jgi:hypothetical protein
MYYRISLEKLLREQCATDRVGRDDFPNDRLRLSMGRWEQIGQRRILAALRPMTIGSGRPQAPARLAQSQQPLPEPPGTITSPHRSPRNHSSSLSEHAGMAY